MIYIFIYYNDKNGYRAIFNELNNQIRSFKIVRSTLSYFEGVLYLSAVAGSKYSQEVLSLQR